VQRLGILRIQLKVALKVVENVRVVIWFKQYKLMLVKVFLRPGNSALQLCHNVSGAQP